jgi:hypothetical protein
MKKLDKLKSIEYRMKSIAEDVNQVKSSLENVDVEVEYLKKENKEGKETSKEFE